MVFIKVIVSFMSAFEVFCCIYAGIVIFRKLFSGRTKYERMNHYMLLEKLLKTLPEKERRSWKISLLIGSIVDLTAIIILCRVISRLF